MPLNALRKVLQAEIRPPSFRSTAGLFQWLRDGLAIALPKSITQSGWRTKTLQVSTDPTGEKSFCTVEQSRFGVRRATRVNADDGSLPIEATLPPDLIFTSKVTLPPAAAKSLATTIGLRLGDISPIPPKDAAFAVCEKTRTVNNRIEADVAIARKETLLGLHNSAGGDRIISIGAKPDEQGKYKFVFEKPKRKTQFGGHLVIDAALIAAVVLMLFAAIDANIKNRLQNLERYEASILTELRAVRGQAALFDDIEPTGPERLRGVQLASAFQDLQSALALLPDGVLLDSLNYQPDVINLSGFAPSPLKETLRFKPHTIMPANRPGFDKFAVRIEPGSTP
jgi:hypothetical protein